MKIYLSEPIADGPVWVDDLGPLPAATAAPAARRRGLRNWQKFVMCYAPAMAGGALYLYGYAGMAVALVALLIWLATALIILTLAARLGRL